MTFLSVNVGDRVDIARRLEGGERERDQRRKVGVGVTPSPDPRVARNSLACGCDCRVQRVVRTYSETAIDHAVEDKGAGMRHFPTSDRDDLAAFALEILAEYASRTSRVVRDRRVESAGKFDGTLYQPCCPFVVVKEFAPSGLIGPSDSGVRTLGVRVDCEHETLVAGLVVATHEVPDIGWDYAFIGGSPLI